MTNQQPCSNSDIRPLPRIEFLIDDQPFIAHVAVCDNMFYSDYKYRFRILPADLIYCSITNDQIYEAVSGLIDQLGTLDGKTTIAENIGPIVGVFFSHDSDAMRFKLMLN